MAHAQLWLAGGRASAREWAAAFLIQPIRRGMSNEGLLDTHRFTAQWARDFVNIMQSQPASGYCKIV